MALCLFSLIAFTISSALAQAPFGTFSFTPNSPLIDLSGDFHTSTTINGGPALDFHLQLTNSPNGRITTNGIDSVTFLQIGDDIVAAQYVAVGKVSGGGLHPTRLSLIVKLTGGGPILGFADTDFTIILRYNMFLNVQDGNFEGSIHGTVHINGLGPGTVRDDAAVVSLPDGIDGSWEADLNIVPFNHLTGTGTISLPNGRSLQGVISGSYSARTGVSKITLKGIDQDKGFSVTFTATQGDDGLDLATVRGRVLGQTVFE